MGLSCRSIRAHGATTMPASSGISARYGRRYPSQTDYVGALKPLLDAVGNEPNLTVILFTLDETSYSRELAPLAGHYPH